MINKRGKELLSHLRQNSRKSLSKISKESTIPISTLFDTLKKLESKFIVKHSSLLDYSKMGFDVHKFFAISSNDKQKVKDFLINSKHVNTISLLIGDYDLLADCIFKDMNECDKFTSIINNISKEIREITIKEEIKQEEFLMN